MNVSHSKLVIKRSQYHHLRLFQSIFIISWYSTQNKEENINAREAKTCVNVYFQRLFDVIRRVSCYCQWLTSKLQCVISIWVGTLRPFRFSSVHNTQENCCKVKLTHHGLLTRTQCYVYDWCWVDESFSETAHGWILLN